MTKIFHSKINLIILVLLIGVLIFPLLVQAQSEELKDALKDVDQKTDQVDKISQEKTNTISTDLPTDEGEPALTVSPDQTPVKEDSMRAEPSSELVAKIEAFSSIIGFSLVEIDEIQAKVKEVIKNTDDPKIEKAAQASFELLKSRRLHLLEKKPEPEKVRITGYSIATDAADLKDWRENIYNPEIKNSLDLYIIHQANLIIQKTDSRMKKVSQDVVKIEAFTKTDSLTPYLNKANQILEKARLNFVSARDLITSAMLARSALLSPPEEEKETQADPEPTIKEVPIIKQAEEFETIDELTPIEESNLAIEAAHTAAQLYAEQISEEIRAVYGTLFDMSAAAKKLLAK